MITAERSVAHSLYIDASGVPKDVVVTNKAPIRFYDASFPYEGQLERLDYRIVTGADGAVPVGFIGGLHPPEHMVATLARDVFSQDTHVSRLEAWNVHVLGSVFGERRGYVRPLQPDERIRRIPKNERIYLQDGKRVKHGGVVGIKMDLNRQFTIPYDATSWEDVFRGVSYPEARLLLHMIREFQEMQYVFSFHEDMENGHNFIHSPGEVKLGRDGVYFYDMCPDARTDHDREFVEQLRTHLAHTLISSGYPLFHGIDDVKDRALGNFVDRGYVYQPIIDEHGFWYIDGTFESGVVDLGSRGLLGIKRSFSFEIPGRYPKAHKEQVIRIIKDQFIKPFLQAKIQGSGFKG